MDCFVYSYTYFYVCSKAVEVQPKSIKHKYPVSECDTGFMEISVDQITTELNITYSYSVKYEVCITFSFTYIPTYIYHLYYFD